MVAAAAACASSAAPSPDANAIGPTNDAAMDANSNSQSDAAADAPGTAEPGIVTPDETPGTRLKPIYSKITGSDGSTRLSFVTWRDTQRDETCSFQTLADGQAHCAPSGETPAFGRESYFQDASCTNPVVGFATYASSQGRYCYEQSPTTKRYVRITTPGDQCAATRLAVFPTTGRLALTSVYRKMPDGTCSAQPLSGGQYEIFASPSPLEEVDPNSFVSAVVTDDTPATGARLRVAHAAVSAADGAKTYLSSAIVDSQRNEFCFPLPDKSGTSRCTPYGSRVSTDFGFADQSCTTSVWMVDRPGACKVDARNSNDRYMFDVDSCGRVTLYPRFTGPSLTTIYGKYNGMCSASSVADWDGDFYSTSGLPAPIPPSTLAPVDDVTHQAPAGYYGKPGTRISVQLKGFRSPDGSEVSWLRTDYDSALGTSCYSATLDDGKSYCVGGYRYLDIESSESVFSNSTCTESVVGVHKANAACGAADDPTLKFFSSRAYEQNGCVTQRLYSAGTPTSPATLYSRTSDGSCVVSSYKASDYTVYRTSELTPVPPSTFVEETATLVE